MKGKTKVIISDELIEKVLDDMEKPKKLLMKTGTKKVEKTGKKK